MIDIYRVADPLLSVPHPFVIYFISCSETCMMSTLYSFSIDAYT